MLIELDHRPGSIGRGKTSFMNGVGGLTPANGRVEIYGTEVSRLAAHRRHRHRLGRAFQAATLFPDLTVREMVQVALERRLPTRFWPAALALPPGVRRERRQVRAADDLIGLFGLGDYADKFVAELSTGTRRIVELACLVAGRSRLLCLDEPTAGVAQREAEALVPLLVEVIRTQLAERDAQFDAQAAVGRPMETFFQFINPDSRHLRLLQIDVAASARHDPDVVAGVEGIFSARNAGIHEDHLFVVGGDIDNLDVGQTGALPGVGHGIVDRLGMGAGNDPKRPVVHGGGGAGQPYSHLGQGSHAEVVVVLVPGLAEGAGVLEDELGQEAVHVRTDKITHHRQQPGVGGEFIEHRLGPHDPEDLRDADLRSGGFTFVL
ncbi:MAG: ATP-binding cassette domain-containing protein [bacterium]|nr:ATP-binding cassette domain-containing protein [bacterium]